MSGFKEDANCGLLDENLVCLSLHSDPDLSACSPLVKYVLLRHLFQLSKTDTGGFTMQVH